MRKAIEGDYVFDGYSDVVEFNDEKDFGELTAKGLLPLQANIEESIYPEEEEIIIFKK